MEIKEIQKEAVKAMKERLSKQKIEMKNDLLLCHLIEEVGELVNQINNEKLKRNPIDIDNIGEEIADCIFILSGIAHNYKIDLDESLIKNVKNQRFLSTLKTPRILSVEFLDALENHRFSTFAINLFT